MRSASGAAGGHTSPSRGSTRRHGHGPHPTWTWTCLTFQLRSTLSHYSRARPRATRTIRSWRRPPTMPARHARTSLQRRGEEARAGDAPSLDLVAKAVRHYGGAPPNLCTMHILRCTAVSRLRAAHTFGASLVIQVESGESVMSPNSRSPTPGCTVPHYSAHAPRARQATTRGTGPPGAYRQGFHRKRSGPRPR